MEETPRTTGSTVPVPSMVSPDFIPRPFHHLRSVLDSKTINLFVDWANHKFSESTMNRFRTDVDENHESIMKTLRSVSIDGESKIIQSANHLRRCIRKHLPDYTNNGVTLLAQPITLTDVKQWMNRRLIKQGIVHNKFEVPDDIPENLQPYLDESLRDQLRHNQSGTLTVNKA